MKNTVSVIDAWTIAVVLCVGTSSNVLAAAHEGEAAVVQPSLLAQHCIL